MVYTKQSLISIKYNIFDINISCIHKEIGKDCSKCGKYDNEFLILLNVIVKITEH